MNRAPELAEKIRNGEPLPFLLAGALLCATPVTRLGMWLRLRQPRTRVDARVISYGNITAGGTGKTPAVIERARAEIAAGHKVAILTRGYGSTGRTCEVRTAKDARGRGDLCEVLGDEPALAASKVPDAVIVRCADRVTAARAAIEQHGCDTLILDDGFQYVRLERDENILLIDTSNPFGNGHLLPRGLLREPLTAMKRATAIVLTRCDQAKDLPALLGRLNALCPGVPVRKTRHAPRDLWRAADGVHFALEELSGKRVRAVCGIGNPDAFFKTLETLGVTVNERIRLPDHAEIPTVAFSGASLVVTTEKDAMRIQHPPDNVLALAVELEDYDL